MDIRFVWLALLLTAAFAGPSPAAVVPAARVDRDSFAVLAGDHVIVDEDGRRALSVPAGGGPAEVVLTPPKGWFVGGVGGSLERAAVILLRDNRREDDLPPSAARVFSGPPGGPLTQVAFFSYRREGDWLPLSVQVDGPRIVLHALGVNAADDGYAFRVIVVDDAGQSEVRKRADSAFGVLVGEAYAAATFSNDQEPPDGLAIVDWRTGAQRLAVPALEPDVVDLTADGVAVYDDDRSRVWAVGPQQSSPRLLLGPSRSLSRLRGLAGGMAILTRSDPAGVDSFYALPLGGGVPRAFGVRTWSIHPELPHDAFSEDGRIVHVREGCVIVADSAGSAEAALPPGPCPRAEVAIPFFDAVLDRRGGFDVKVRCIAAPAPGCRGSVRIQRSRVRTRFDVAPGSVATVRVRGDRRARRRIEREMRRSPEASDLVTLIGSAVDPAGRAFQTSTVGHVYRDAAARRRGQRRP